MYQPEDVSYLFQHVAAQFAKQTDQVLQEQLGIGLSQFRILRTLQSEPRTPQKDIAINLGQTEASISRQVKLMIGDGLLQSVHSTKDHREHLMISTAKGERLTEAASTVLAKYFQPMLNALSEKQQSQLAASMETLHSQVCSMTHQGAQG